MPAKIRRMTRVALRVALKYDAINLSQGFPDFDPPAAITDRLAEVAHELGYTDDALDGWRDKLAQ